MFESFLFKLEKECSVLKVFLVTILSVLIIGFVGSLINKNSLYVIFFVSLFLYYPVFLYVKLMNKKEIESQMSAKKLFFRHQRELVVFWGIFLGLLVGFYLLIILPFGLDFSMQENFLNTLKGHITFDQDIFDVILINNLKVGFYTFLISLFVFGGLVFVLAWNASILAYHLHSLGSITDAFLGSFMYLGHGLLEIAGYVFCGIAASVLAYRIERIRSFEHRFDKEFLKDFFMFLFLGVGFIFIAAILEVV